MLWAVTTFFGSSDARRLAHYRAFARAMPLPLMTVELAFWGHPFRLTPADASVLLQINGDQLWQKERCMNVALAALPSDCDAVVIIDSDVVVAGDTAAWAAHVRAALTQHDLIQPFSRVDYLRADGAVDFSWPSVAKAGTAFLPPSRVDVAHGISWAARRDFLQRIGGFHDAFVAGGGDAPISFAAHNIAEQLPAWFKLSPAHSEHYLNWARKFVAARAGSATVPYVDFTVQHLFHGSLASRRHKERKGLLCDFDPARDLRVNSTGGFDWTDCSGQQAIAVQRHLDARDSE